MVLKVNMSLLKSASKDALFFMSMGTVCFIKSLYLLKSEYIYERRKTCYT